MKASPMRANKVTGMRNEVKIGSFGRRLLKKHKALELKEINSMNNNGGRKWKRRAPEKGEEGKNTIIFHNLMKFEK